MGLCKCRTVTTLFCFEHRKNICEKCITTDHPTCIVKSYLQWLQDSEYETQCTICNQPLTVPSSSSLTDGNLNNSLGIINHNHQSLDSSSQSTLDISSKLARLTCLDLFHLKCLTTVCIPSTTDGTIELWKAKCPICQTNIIPPMTMQTPIAKSLRTALLDSSWKNVLLESNVRINI